MLRRISVPIQALLFVQILQKGAAGKLPALRKGNLVPSRISVREGLRESGYFETRSILRSTVF